MSAELTPYASAILLDPEYGLPAAQVRDEQAGLLLAYEKTGYDASTPGRLPDLLSNWSVKRLKENGADACKFCSIMMWTNLTRSMIKRRHLSNGLVRNALLKIYHFS